MPFYCEAEKERFSVRSPGLCITIRVKDMGKETRFKMKKSTQMSRVFSAYAKCRGVDCCSLRWFLHGKRISKDHTPNMLKLELEEDVQINCVLTKDIIAFPSTSTIEISSNLLINHKIEPLRHERAATNTQITEKTKYQTKSLGR